MGNRPCARCVLYRLEIIRLKLRIRELEQTIDRLRRIIAAAYEYAQVVLRESRPILARRSGVERAVWGFHIARYEVAVNVIRRLKSG